MIIALTAALLLTAHGNVATYLDPDGNFIIRGDDEGNQVDLVDQGALELVGWPGTTVNGSTAPSPVPEQIAGVYLIEMGSGHDRFDFLSSEFDRPSYLDMGDGHDVVFMTNGSTREDMVFQMGAGDDVLDVADTAFGAVTFIGGRGDDFCKTAFSYHRGRLSAQLGAGNDELLLSWSNFDSTLVLDGASGIDTYRLHGENNFAWTPKATHFESRSPHGL